MACMCACVRLSGRSARPAIPCAFTDVERFDIHLASSRKIIEEHGGASSGRIWVAAAVILTVYNEPSL